MRALRNPWLVLSLLLCLGAVGAAGLASVAQKPADAGSSVLRLDMLSKKQGEYPAPLEVAAGLDAALTVKEVSALPQERFIAFKPDTHHQISADKPLWLRVQIMADQTSNSNWLLDFQTVIVDRYEVYQRDASGAWQMSAAGDQVAHSQWPTRSLRPRFPLSTAGGGMQETYIRVVHQLPATF